MKLFYDGDLIGEIVTSQSLTIDQACRLLNIDVNATERGEDVYDFGLFAIAT